MNLRHMMGYLRNPRIYLLGIFLVSTFITQLYLSYRQNTLTNAASEETCTSEPAPLFETKPQSIETDKNRVKALNEQLQTIIADMKNPLANNETLKKNAIGLAQERKNSFLTLARNDPGSAKALLLDQDSEDVLSAISENCVEEPTILTGELLTRHVDFYPDDASKDGVFLKRDDGSLLQLHPTVLDTRLKSGTTVSVKGLKLDSDVLIDMADPESLIPTKKKFRQRKSTHLLKKLKRELTAHLARKNSLSF
jgi:hypothetical protein